MFCNGKRTEWNSILSVIIRLKTKSDDRAAGDESVYHKPNWTTGSLITRTTTIYFALYVKCYTAKNKFHLNKQNKLLRIVRNKRAE